MPTPGPGAQKSRAQSDGDALDGFQMEANKLHSRFEVRPENPFLHVRLPQLINLHFMNHGPMACIFNIR